MKRLVVWAKTERKDEMAKAKAKQGEVTISPGARRLFLLAVDSFRPYQDEEPVAAAMRKLTAVAKPTDFEADQLAKSIGDLTELRKRDDLDPETRSRVSKTQREVEGAYLGKYSPAAHEHWVAERRRQGLG